MTRVLQIALLVLVLAAVNAARAQEHPVPLEANVDAAKCLECHEDKSKGPHVHSAIAMGCTTCHEVKTEKDTTTITLTQPKEQLCFTCHDKQSKETDTVHGPYDKGNCVTCHDPHVSQFDKQLRAEGNTLCLECHAPKRAQDKVTLFQTVEMSKDDFNQIPKVDLDPMLRFGHPMDRHPVVGVDPRDPKAKITCLSCHQPHTSPAPKLMVVSKNAKNKDICASCHTVMDQKATEAAAKKTADAEAAGPVVAGPAAKNKKK